MGDTWTINYLPTEGGRITGKLEVGGTAVTFEGLYDSSNSTVIKNVFGAAASFAASGGTAAYLSDTDTEFTITLPRAGIASAEQVKKGLMKRAVITMTDGATFVFDYGMLSPKKLVAALNG